MEKTNKFVDPMDKLFAPPPNRTRWQTFKLFLYNSETGAFLGRTASSWAKITVFYIIFYACLAAMFAVCMWGLLQTVSDESPTYLLDNSIIGSSPGLSSRPVPSMGSTSVMSFNLTTSTWSNSEWPELLGEFFEEYKSNSTGHPCNFGIENQLPCIVDVASWKDCQPTGNQITAACIYFKINKIIQWMPTYYTDPNNLPSEMPEDLKTAINDTPEARREMVWLSCEGRHDTDKELVHEIEYYPDPGFPGYYFPFRRQADYKSPVVAVHFKNITTGREIDVECRAWAPNIQHDRRNQLGLLSFKLKFNE